MRDGRAEFELLAPHDPQDVLLRVTSGSHSAEGVVGFVPEMRELIATGLIEGVINFRRKGDNLVNGTQRGDGFEREIRRWEKQFNSGKANGAARAAFFVKGTIKGEYLLTAAYDSDKEVRARLLRDIQPVGVPRASPWPRIYPALATGGYAPPVVLHRPIDANQTASLAVGDFNADGRNDLVLDEARTGASMHLYIQDSQGNFASSMEIPRQSGASGNSLIATDLNRDGRTDLAIAHSGWGYIGYYLQTDTLLTPETIVDAYQFLGRHNYFATGDINHDGCGDLVISRWTQSPVLLYGQGCAPPRVVACCSQPRAIEDSASSAARSASPLTLPSHSADANADGGTAGDADPRLGRNARRVPATPASMPPNQNSIPILDP